MAIFMGNNVAVVFGTTTISSFVSTVSLTREIDQVEITALSDTTANMIAGIERPVLNLELYNDFAASSINSLFENALGTKVAIKLIPVSGTVTTTNPSYTCTTLITSWQPIDGKTDGVATITASYPVTGIVKATS